MTDEPVQMRAPGASTTRPPTARLGDWADGDLALDACNRVYLANIHRPGGRYVIATWLTFGSDRAAARIGEECQEGSDCCCSEPHVPLRRATVHASEVAGHDGA